jgi:hypothetical protein
MGGYWLLIKPSNQTIDEPLSSSKFSQDNSMDDHSPILSHPASISG